MDIKFKEKLKELEECKVELSKLQARKDTLEEELMQLRFEEHKTEKSNSIIDIP